MQEYLNSGRDRKRIIQKTLFELRDQAGDDTRIVELRRRNKGNGRVF